MIAIVYNQDMFKKLTLWLDTELIFQLKSDALRDGLSVSKFIAKIYKIYKERQGK